MNKVEKQAYAQGWRPEDKVPKSVPSKYIISAEEFLKRLNADNRYRRK